jgi:hypothetical protein
MAVARGTKWGILELAEVASERWRDRVRREVVVVVEEERVGVVRIPGSSRRRRTIQPDIHTHLREAKVLEWLQAASLLEQEPK